MQDWTVLRGMELQEKEKDEKHTGKLSRKNRRKKVVY